MFLLAVDVDQNNNNSSSWYCVTAHYLFMVGIMMPIRNSQRLSAGFI
jgi:hypothetical protein